MAARMKWGRHRGLPLRVTENYFRNVTLPTGDKQKMKFRHYVLLPLLAASLSLSAAETPADRTGRLGQALLKIVRIEQQAYKHGAALSGPEKLADSLLVPIVKTTDPACIGKFLQSVEGECSELLAAFLNSVEGLSEPKLENDPAAAVISALKEKLPAFRDTPGALEGYATAFLLNLESRRDLGLRLEVTGLLMAAGCPVTLKDLGLEREDTTTIRELAAMMAVRTGPQGYPCGAFEFGLTLTRLDDLGGRFGRQQDESTLLARLEKTAAFQDILPALTKLKLVTVGFFGDSQTDNRHWSSPAHFPKIIEAVFAKYNTGLKSFNAGVGGDDSAEGLARIEKDVLGRHPDYCFVLFGGNDCAFWGRGRPGLEPEQFSRNMSEIVSRLEGIGCRPVLLSYPLIPEFSPEEHAVLGRMNARLAGLRDDKTTGWLDIGGLFDSADSRVLFAVDRIHFCPAGHLLIAQKVLEYLCSQPALNQ